MVQKFAVTLTHTFHKSPSDKRPLQAHKTLIELNSHCGPGGLFGRKGAQPKIGGSELTHHHREVE